MVLNECFVIQETKGPKTLEEESKTILRTRNYTIYIKDTVSGLTDTIPLQPDDVPLFRTPHPEDEDQRNHKLMKNKGHFQTAIRKLTESTYFFPSGGLYRLICFSESIDNSTESLSCNIQQQIDKSLKTSVNMKQGIFDIKVKSAPGSNPANMKIFYVTDIEPAKALQDTHNSEYMDAQCSLGVSTTNNNVVDSLKSYFHQ